MATEANPACWVMMRHGQPLLQIPRLCRTVETDALCVALAAAEIEAEQFFNLCLLCVPAQWQCLPIDCRSNES